jgi:hypothetical protein
MPKQIAPAIPRRMTSSGMPGDQYVAERNACTAATSMRERSVEIT